MSTGVSLKGARRVVPPSTQAFFLCYFWKKIVLSKPQFKCHNCKITWQLCLYACQVKPCAWVKVKHFENPELQKFKYHNPHYACKISTIFSLDGWLSLEKLKINERCNYNLLNSAFWGWLSTESQPQNPEFRNNPEKFHPCLCSLSNWNHY